MFLDGSLILLHNCLRMDVAGCGVPAGHGTDSSGRFFMVPSYVEG